MEEQENFNCFLYNYDSSPLITTSKLDGRCFLKVCLKAESEMLTMNMFCCVKKKSFGFFCTIILHYHPWINYKMWLHRVLANSNSISVTNFLFYLLRSHRFTWLVSVKILAEFSSLDKHSLTVILLVKKRIC